MEATAALRLCSIEQQTQSLFPRLTHQTHSVRAHILTCDTARWLLQAASASYRTRCLLMPLQASAEPLPV